MKVDLTEEELYLINQYRNEKRNKHRPDKNYTEECMYVHYDADGDYCGLRMGSGVNSHCWANQGKECLHYCRKERGNAK